MFNRALSPSVWQSCPGMNAFPLLGRRRSSANRSGLTGSVQAKKSEDLPLDRFEARIIAARTLP